MHGWLDPRRLTRTALLYLVALAAPALGSIESQLQHLLGTADLRGTQVSVYVTEVDSGRMLVDIEGDRAMIPASNMKLLTTAAALDTLGADFLFKTRLGMIDAADTADGSEKPALIIIGDGDPAFGDPVTLDAAGYDPDQIVRWWVDTVVETGITKFGQIIVDDRVFEHGPQQRIHPTWPRNQLHKHYCAQVMGINFFNNVFQVTASPTKIGQDVELGIYPYGPFVRTELGVVTGRVDQWDIITRPDDNRIGFRGQVRNRQRQLVTMHDPAMVFGQMLKHELSKRGVTVDQVTRPEGNKQMPEVTTLHQINTTLQAVLVRTNRDSMNLYAEALLKRTGYAITGTPGTFENGASAVRRSLTRVLDNPTLVSTIRIADGSGLSRNNRVTARAVATLLTEMHHHAAAQAFRVSLARPGETGSLRSRFEDQDLAGELYAKSGYINTVSALSGYLVYPDRGDGGKTLAFSILCNGFGTGDANQLDNSDMKSLQEQIITMLDTSMTQPTE
ncbi:MAG: D-alanyl-D-alanine carboxypeptidase/D-alanyl-D-alanine-endopeptidase [Planctomycetota bacterium]